MLWADVTSESFPGIDGFLGTRASFMLDVVFLAMLAIVPVLCWSVYLVRYRRNYALHKRIQLLTGLVLLVAVVAFEVMCVSCQIGKFVQNCPLITRWMDGARFGPPFPFTCYLRFLPH